ncbi:MULTISPECIES: DUF2092 domain-containing protein [Sinorhizobium/Ensifer group]|uniref:DUF2092 domain-containing protein n=1 Tax=Ensifer adhaerens TaxID=106592 RepID=UPI000FDA7872|nr:DUF2092 domain-containing protein [Ensifer adhaerens]MDF8357447.1 DUF2092 domain-containing protein [Ensifer adhaerens]THA57694.1 DUF2092 domain-containing protein [Ensifer adhaerens]
MSSAPANLPGQGKILSIVRISIAESSISRRFVRGMLALLILSATPSSSSWAQDTSASNLQYSREALQQALQTKEQYDMPGLRFAIAKSTLRAGAEQLLDDVAAVLMKFPDWSLRIVVHTDASGDAETNQRLSQERAEIIKAALVKRGISADKLMASGAGQTLPVASNKTAEGRTLNRRVELIRVIDSPEAKKLLKSMSDYLAAQKALSFSYDSNLQVVTNADQKLGLSSSGTVNLSRPDRVHTTRSGGFVDTETLFDGKTLTLLGKNVNKYTQVEMHGTVDQLIDELKDKHGLPLPAADLLMTNSYEELMTGVYDAKDLGSGFVNGKECDSLAFRKDDVDFQIWVAQGEQPYPCRLVITSSKVKGGPEYSIQIRDWKSGDGVPADDFAFENTTNAEKADVNDLKQKMSEMPDNFVMGDGK